MRKKIRRDPENPGRGMQVDDKLDAILDLLQLIAESQGVEIPDWIKRKDPPGDTQ